MCGIVYVKRKDKKPAYKAVLKRYRRQKGRGTEGYGYVSVKNGEIVNYERATTEEEIIKKISQEDAEEILFHHRNPTSTPNVVEEAHPLLIENDKLLDHQYFVAHNGVIRNDATLKEKHEKMGFKYLTELVHGFTATSTNMVYPTFSKWNDSEALAIETALAIDGKQKKIWSEGAAAVIGFQTKGRKIINRFFYRNNINPLHFHEDKQMITVTSNGHGQKPVEAIYVQRLRANGGHEDFGGIFTPWGFRGQPSTYNWQNRQEPKEPIVNYNFYEKDDFSVRSLPPARSEPVGFHQRTREDMDIDLGPREQDDDFDFPLGAGSAEDDGAPTGFLSVNELMEETSIISWSESDKNLRIFRGMDDATLYEEYEYMLGLHEQLKRGVDKFDEKVEILGSFADDNTTNFRIKMQERLDAIQAYLDDCSRELTKRASLGALKE